MDKVQAWSDHIILHFWHSASICKTSATTSDEEALKLMKVNVHVVKFVFVSHMFNFPLKKVLFQKISIYSLYISTYQFMFL